MASAAGAVAHQAGWLASAQSALERGPRRHKLPWGKSPGPTPLSGAAIVPEETANAVVAPNPPVLLLAPASTLVGAVADSPVEPPVAPEVGMAEAPLLEVVPDLPSLGHKEKAAAVAEVGDRGPDALGEGRAEPRPVLGSSVLIPKRRNPNEWCGSAFRFWSRGASYPSSSSTTSGRSSLGMSSVSMPRRRRGRFGRPWRSFLGTFPGSFR
jgi:hypothetical protein